jgi:hypothetical protein
MTWPYSTFLASFSALVIVLAWSPMRRWGRKVRRRRGGVYLVRCDHHLNRARRVNGYVGETVSHHLRQRQHLGMSRFDPATGQAVKSGFVKVTGQPWTDLNPVWHKLTLPWWLCWKWVLRPLETVVILLTWPVYNDAKNHWNPRRIPKSIAKAQRATREAGGLTYAGRVVVAHAGRILFRLAGLGLILGGLFGWAVTR